MSYATQIRKIVSRASDKLRRPLSRDVETYRELQHKLATIPRYQAGTVTAGDWHLNYLDAMSVLSNFDVVVVKRWNDFPCDKSDPVILDCGGNIGISAIHYKHQFPAARVISFEPDPRACEVLRRNLLANNVNDVQVVEKALWTSNGRSDFFSEGADAGRLVADLDQLTHLTSLTPIARQCSVETVRLADYLSNGEVDFVKIDIEGAETEVLADCANLLDRVRAMVIEFHLTTSRPRDLACTLNILADSAFHVSVGSYGPWVDLLHRTSGTPNESVEFDQNLLICAWRQ